MKMTHKEMESTAHLIAKESPSTLLKALRDNGFWLYTINTIDIEEAISDGHNEDLLPITDNDINYVNHHDRISEVIPYEDVMNEVIHQIRGRRNDSQ